jgi:hypothetical protein
MRGCLRVTSHPTAEAAYYELVLRRGVHYYL